ncbi:hypothetical protein EPN87_02655 [archaeon]|nr:MAG: hypothetical protein EPN87_02655 [archaeon]
MRNIATSIALGGVVIDSISALYKALSEPVGYRVVTEPYVAGLIVGSVLVVIGVYKVVKEPKTVHQELKNI